MLLELRGRQILVSGYCETGTEYLVPVQVKATITTYSSGCYFPRAIGFGDEEFDAVWHWVFEEAKKRKILPFIFGYNGSIELNPNFVINGGY